MLETLGPKKRGELTVGGCGGRPYLKNCKPKMITKTYNWNATMICLQYLDISAIIAASNGAFSPLGTSHSGKKNAKSGNDARDDTTINTISAEEWEAGPPLLLSTNGVKSMIEENLVNGKVNAVTSHVGCSSKVIVNHGRLHHVTRCKPHKRKVAKKKDKNGREYVRNTLSSHEANVKVVIGALAMGVGGKNISTMMAILDLPHGKNFSNNATSKIEDEISVVICDMAAHAMPE
eukprot:4024813-Ditylum_brightwellii.AAC.1